MSKNGIFRGGLNSFKDLFKRFGLASKEILQITRVGKHSRWCEPCPKNAVFLRCPKLLKGFVGKILGHFEETVIILPFEKYHMLQFTRIAKKFDRVGAMSKKRHFSMWPNFL